MVNPVLELSASICASRWPASLSCWGRNTSRRPASGSERFCEARHDRGRSHPNKFERATRNQTRKTDEVSVLCSSDEMAERARGCHYASFFGNTRIFSCFLLRSCENGWVINWDNDPMIVGEDGPIVIGRTVPMMMGTHGYRMTLRRRS